jgi:predicted transcriptional regulator
MSDMRTEKLAVRVAPKKASRLRKIAQAQRYETLSAWIRSLLDAEIERDDARRAEISRGAEAAS